MKKLLVLLLLFGSPFADNVQGQSQDLLFERIRLPGGAYGNNVTSIVQDRQGFMWFGTWGGLHKYDGYEVTTFIHRNTDSTSVSNTWIESIHVDRDGVLWVGTFGGGLNRFNRETDSFTHFRNDPSDESTLSGDVVTVILEDRSGVLWVGTHSGLNRFNRAQGTFTRFQNDPENPQSLSDNQVRALYEDKEGTLWIGTGSPSDPPAGIAGLNRFDPVQQSFTRYLHDSDREGSLVDSQVRALLEDSKGNFWVGSWGDGLHTMDRGSGTFTRYPFDPQEPGQLSRPHLLEDPGQGGVAFVHEDASGALWIGAADGGLNRYDPQTGALDHFEHDPDDVRSLSDNRVWTICESRDGLLWIGTLGGLQKIDPSGSYFPYYAAGPTGTSTNVRAIVETEPGNLWLGTSNGLHMFNRESGTFSHYDYPILLNGVRVLALHKDPSGMIWIGTWGNGLYSFRPETGATRHYEHRPGNSNSLSGNTVLTIYEDRHGFLWLGTDGAGLTRFDAENNVFVHYAHDPDDPNSLSQNNVSAIVEDDAGDLWVGTYAGLNRLDRETDTFRRYVYDPDEPTGLNDNVILSIFEDRSARLWIGTEAGGFGHLDRSSGEFKHLTTDNSGLSDNRVNAITEDGRGNLWLSTGSGLVKFSPEDSTFQSYGASRGLPAEPFYPGSKYNSPTGELFFGGRNGFHAFFPERVGQEINPYRPPVALSNFWLSDQLVLRGPDSPLRTTISEADEIVLSHDQNDFSISFVALHYSNPERNQYTFKLEPYEESWREPGLRRRADYTNLDPGEYVFNAKASNSNGVWNEEGTSIRIVIEPPFWALWWFRIPMAVIVFGLVYGGYRVRVWQIQKQNVRLAREVKERTNDLERSLQMLTETQDQLVHAHKMASLGQLTAGIAHEIKNPLNFVINFAALSVDLVRDLRSRLGGHDGSAADDNVEGILSDLGFNAEKIEEHGKRADGIIQSMLDHSRGHSDDRVLMDLNSLLEEFVNIAFHSQRAQHPDLSVSFERDYDPAVGEVEIVRQEIGRVLVILLNNAMDAVHARASSEEGPYTPIIGIRSLRVNYQIEVRVSDNGLGIPPEIQERIFDPFFTTKPIGEGTGLGLSLSYEIVTQGHGGTLTMESEEGQGATFIIVLPSNSNNSTG